MTPAAAPSEPRTPNPERRTANGERRTANGERNEACGRAPRALRRGLHIVGRASSPVASALQAVKFLEVCDGSVKSNGRGRPFYIRSPRRTANGERNEACGRAPRALRRGLHIVGRASSPVASALQAVKFLEMCDGSVKSNGRGRPFYIRSPRRTANGERNEACGRAPRALRRGLHIVGRASSPVVSALEAVKFLEVCDGSVKSNGRGRPFYIRSPRRTANGERLPPNQALH